MDDLDLADWRERMARLYLSEVDLVGFRRGRDELFATHPQSPTLGGDFDGLRYFPPNPAAVIEAPLRPAEGSIQVDTGGPDGVLDYRRVAIADTIFGPLTLWWLSAYGGGLFLPFRDATAPRESYGGGRYLTDTVKGTFGRAVTIVDGGTRAKLDFNYAYNPSCAYDSHWACPLAPPENRLTASIRAGELNYHSPA